MSRRNAGFTLLEVVLAMTSLAMLTAIVYGAFHLGTRALEKGQNAVVTAQRLRAANDVLIRQIKSIVAYPARNEDDGAFWYFKGGPTSMSFVTAAGLQGGGGLVEITYRVEDDPPRLVITENPFISPDTLGRGRVERAGARSAMLLDGFRQMNFRYWDPDEGDPPGYAPKWNPLDHDRLPAAIEISVEGLPGIETDKVVQEIPIASFEFSGTIDPEELMNEEAPETPGAPGAATGPGATPGSGQTAQQPGKEEPEEADEADDEAEADD